MVQFCPLRKWYCLESLRWKTTIANNHCLVKLSILKKKMCLVQKHKLDFTKTMFLGGKENF